jgi:hypothetical protein
VFWIWNPGLEWWRRLARALLHLNRNGVARLHGCPVARLRRSWLSWGHHQAAVAHMKPLHPQLFNTSIDQSLARFYLRLGWKIWYFIESKGITHLNYGPSTVITFSTLIFPPPKSTTHISLLRHLSPRNSPNDLQRSNHILRLGQKTPHPLPERQNSQRRGGQTEKARHVPSHLPVATHLYPMHITTRLPNANEPRRRTVSSLASCKL